MDTVTQIILGAAVGQAVGYRRIGRTALALGAIGGTLPDLDVVGNSLGSLAEWQYHRGFTHSLFFGPILGPVLGYATWRFYRWRDPTGPGAQPRALGPLIGLWILAILTHPLLDLFTVYGTQLLAPLSDTRFVIPAVSIIDPNYTVVLLIAVILGLMRRSAGTVATATAAALLLSTVYLFYCWEQNLKAEGEARRQLAAQGVRSANVRSYTTIFQPWLRRLVAQDEAGIRVGFVSTWKPSPILWTCQRRPDDPAIARALATPEMRILERFSGGQVWPLVTRDAQGNTVVRFTDLRYGVSGVSTFGWWGIDVSLDPAGQVTGARRIAIPRPPVSWGTVGAVYRAGLGELDGYFAAVGVTMEQAASGC